MAKLLYLTSNGERVLIYESRWSPYAAKREIAERGFCPLKCDQRELRILVNDYGAKVEPLK